MRSFDSMQRLIYPSLPKKNLYFIVICVCFLVDCTRRLNACTVVFCRSNLSEAVFWLRKLTSHCNKSCPLDCLDLEFDDAGSCWISVESFQNKLVWTSYQNKLLSFTHLSNSSLFMKKIILSTIHLACAGLEFCKNHSFLIDDSFLLIG